MSEAEDFLKKNTGYCQPLRMWLTPASCAAIKNRGGNGWNYSGDAVEQPRQCAACPGVIVQPDAYQAPMLANTPQKTEQPPTLRSSTMTKQTYTPQELATLFGVTVKDIANAKYSPTKNPIPGSANHTIREEMRERGITWDQLAPGGVGRKPGSVKTKKSGPVLLPVEGKTPAQDDAQPAAPAPAMETAKQDENFEAILPPAEGKTCALSLEELIAELKQRLPGAAITISL